jgi:GNAT superfamily N-acetyltransferase/RimJ/RimL family protein N-acetyltransferase
MQAARRPGGRLTAGRTDGKTACPAGLPTGWLAGVHFEQFDPLTDAARLQACREIFEASRRADDPAAPEQSPAEFRGRWAYGFEGRDPRQAWLATDAAGPAACYLLELPDRENVTLGTVALAVPPSRRRRGIGTALLAHCAGQARGAGRTTVQGSAGLDSPGEAFARAAGAAGGLTDVRRVLHPADLTPERLARLRAEAEARAAGYTLVTWTGPAPDEYVDQVAPLYEVLADAPRDEGVAAPRVDAGRVRAIEASSAGPEFRVYTVAARHDASGTLAALTLVIVPAQVPGQALQALTAVGRPHRGHRLGLLVKVAVHEWLARAEPGLRAVFTWNAQANEHMIAINEQLGYRVSGRFRSWELAVGGQSHPPASPQS